MKDRLNKIISIPFIYIGLLSILDFFFKDYNDQNNYDFSIVTYLIIFITVVAIVMFYVVKNSQETDKFIKLAKGFAYGVFFGLMMVLFVTLVKDQTGFHLNKMYANTVIEEDFEIINRAVIDNDSVVGLKSINHDYRFITRNKFSLENLIYIQDNDIITLNMGIGLFNQPFLPYGKLEIIK